MTDLLWLLPLLIPCFLPPLLPFLRRRIAKRNLRRAKGFYGGTVEYGPATLSDMPWLDTAWYERSSQEMALAGFEPMGDFESLTLTRHYPSMRTLERFFLEKDSAIAGAIYQFKMRGWIRLASPFARNFNEFIISFATEFENGTFLYTTTGHRAAPGPPGIKVIVGPANLAGLLAQHRHELQETAASGGIAVVQVRSVEDILASVAKMHALQCAQRQQAGYLTAEDLEKASGGPLSVEGRRFLEVFEELRDREAESGGHNK